MAKISPIRLSTACIWICLNLILGCRDQSASGGPSSPNPAGGAPVPSPLSGQPVPKGPTGFFDLVFSDEFDGDQIDQSKWNLTWPWTTPLNNTLQNFSPQNVVIKDGRLSLIAEKRPSGGQAYTSGAITTYQRGEGYIEGVFEARLKLPAGKGFWSAFWMIYPTGEWPPEIDIIEMLGPQPKIPFMTYHYKVNDNIFSKNIAPITDQTDLTTDFHIYSVEWRGDRIIWYIDGVEQGSFAESAHLPEQKMILLLNLSIGGGAGGFGPGVPDSTTVFPTSMEVDYVRVWTRK